MPAEIRNNVKVKSCVLSRSEYANFTSITFRVKYESVTQMIRARCEKAIQDKNSSSADKIIHRNFSGCATQDDSSDDNLMTITI